jgi:hypothetical protein
MKMHPIPAGTQYELILYRKMIVLLMINKAPTQIRTSRNRSPGVFIDSPQLFTCKVLESVYFKYIQELPVNSILPV